MKISDKYRKGNIPVSFEIFPPKGELHPDELRSVLTELKDVDPAFISVTCSAGGTGGSSARTAHLAGIIQQEYGVTAAAHITCLNATRADIDAAVAEVRAQGLTNVLALRGDRVEGYEATDFHYGADLIRYLRSSPAAKDLCIGAGCYPEGHVDCGSLDEDIDHLKEKADAGAEFLISQLFFDNEAFFRFIDSIRARGISLPVDAGIMPIMGKSQITRMIFLCGASLPAAIVRMLAKYEHSPEDLLAASMDYASRQIAELSASGAADGIHIYSMNKPHIARALSAAVQHGR